MVKTTMSCSDLNKYDNWHDYRGNMVKNSSSMHKSPIQKTTLQSGTEINFWWHALSWHKINECFGEDINENFIII